ncbi:MAG: SPOR domain-containing protein [Bacteroidales bacterium]|nr:SPOR domain-containing protein [Bacteroidales bacterium]
MSRLALLFTVLFLAALVILFTLPPKDISLLDLEPARITHISENDQLMTDSTHIDSLKQETAFESNDVVKNDEAVNSNAGTKTEVLTENNISEKKDEIVKNIKPVIKSNNETKISESYSSVVYYYIIVESFKNLTTARQKADKLSRDFKTDFIVLPPTKEGLYRVSCGKYETLEEARATINSVRNKIRPDVWIFSASSAAPRSQGK